MNTAPASGPPITTHLVPGGHIVHCHEHGRITTTTDPINADTIAELHELTIHGGWA